MTEHASTRPAPIGRLGDIDLRLLRLFKTVAESGGFTAAAPALGIGRSAVSLHVKELEQRLGFVLCQRGRAGFVLTPEGAAVYEATERLLAQLQSFRNDLNNLHDTLRGTLAIGITDNLVTLPEMRITDALAALKDRGPQVHLTIHMMDPRRIETAVIDGRLQVGVVPVVERLAALDYIPLYDERALLYCRADHPLAGGGPVSLADIEAADAVVPAHALSAEGRTLVARLNATATATEREGIAFLVLTGRYIGLLPEHYAAQWVSQGRLVALRPADFAHGIDYYAVTRAGRRPNRILETFLDGLTDDSGS